MKLFQRIGLSIFLAAMVLFIAILFMTRYEVNSSALDVISSKIKEPHRPLVIQELSALKGESLGGKFSFIPKVKTALKKVNETIAGQYEVSDEVLEQYLEAAKESSNGSLSFTEDSRLRANELLPESMRQTVSDYTGWLIGRTFNSEQEYYDNVKNGVTGAINGVVNNAVINDYDQKNYTYEIVKATSTGPYWKNKYPFFVLIFIFGTIGALMWIFPAFYDGMPGIKHNHIYHSSATSQGIVGIMLGSFMISFYLMLYFFHYVIAEWITLVDPVSMWIRGEAASQWFMYGFIYTVAILVMGIRMFTKYRHSRYHQVRTASVMFFQTAFAFILPQILYRLNQPEMDLKDAWPLNYDFFFEWNIAAHIEAGNLGIFMLGWGIALFLIGVPLFTYFYGKRWYCSWVCGCGGLAETLGDPFRQLSDKSLKAWKIERYLIHGVMVFAVLMTGMVLYTYFTGQSTILGLNSFTVRSWYGLLISSWFAGVVGTGFYPLMGNRVWCRFGCPLAAYLGFVQRFKSKFRITTNGGQCISCGNCSTYCEMGIDVRAYAQRGQNIVRSSCVGCGVCAAVCPRGVLSLENMDNDDKSRMDESRY